MAAEITLRYLLVILAFLVFATIAACAAALWLICRDMRAKRELNRRLHERAQKDISRW